MRLAYVSMTPGTRVAAIRNNFTSPEKPESDGVRLYFSVRENK